MELSGRLALITGGASGIGKEVARRLLREGARVALWDLDDAALERARAELSPLGEVRVWRVDASDRAAVAATAAAVEREMGPVDILDNNAAVVQGGGFTDCSEESLGRTIEVNVTAVLWCTRAFLPGMIARGRGRVVMMASAAGLVGVPGMAAYSASKHAVVGLAESLRLELRRGGHAGVGVTLVCPSFVRTGMFAGGKPPLLTPWLEPDQLAALIVAAVRDDRPAVLEPFMIKFVPLLKGLLGRRFFDILGDALGTNSAMDHWTGRAPASARREP